MIGSNVSIIIPAKNEAESLRLLLPDLQAVAAATQIYVVDDGSTDSTREVCVDAGVNVIGHPYSKGNGAAIKTGARAAEGEILVFMDADGQHRPEDIPRLLGKLDEGYDMVVGARDRDSQASFGRLAANSFYNAFASWMSGHEVADLTSGFRVARADQFRQFLYLLPNGFSYPSTITMAFFRAGYSITYEPIVAPPRIGKSHIRLLRDGTRFLLIIFRVGTLYSPLKVFFPVSFGAFGIGLTYYVYTYATSGRFTNMGMLMFMLAILVFLMGLISEQITNLMYHRKD